MLDHNKINDDDALRRKARRAREFHRYLRPNQILTPDHDSLPSTSDIIPNFSLAFSPHCQLTALRCRAKKAMINLMDRETMYFVSESSLLRNSIDGEDHYQFVEDPILASCTSTVLEGRICELTLHLDAKQDQRPSMFVVPDLSQSQFSQLPVVAGPPYYRFYAGTPITTSQGINIGSLAIMDDCPRQGLTRDLEDFMAVTATQIMTCLETHRQAAEGNRARRMTAGLKAFFAGQSTTHHSTPPDSSLQRSRVAYRLPAPSPEAHEYIEGGNPDSFFDSSPASNHLQSTTSRKNDALDPNTSLSAPTSRYHILQRAAALIRECLDSTNDTTATFFGIGKNPLNTPEDKASMFSQAHDLRGTKASQRRLRRPARIAARVAPVDSVSGNTGHNHSDSIDEDFLRSLAKLYPEGHLWNLEEDDLSSGEDDATKLTVQMDPLDQTKILRRHRRENEIQSVRAAFPSAHQVLFAPLFDADSALTSYCLFVESTNDVHSLNASTDLPFLLTFCSSITTEISKMEALLINKQKSDFVGTISHEMRSPLHGILGSAEFLAETDLTNFQQSLIKTIETCGKTLFDTISHVLDYSKINSFEKQLTASNGSRTANLEQAQIGDMTLFDGNMNEASPLSQIAADTDVAAVLEEVVDSLVRGWSFTQNVDLTDISHVSDGSRLGGLPNDRHSKECAVVHPEVYIDIEPLNWLFLTQPGALRRIFMNVVGNALKFTRQGNITISLSSKATSNENQSSIVVFTVIDTGSGISPDFLDSKLFLPFAQENALTPGTGLGLSIVYNIVKMLGGWTDVKSVIGHGTTVQVEIPLKRSNLGQTPIYSPTRSRSRAISTTSNDSIMAVRKKASTITAAFYPAIQGDTQTKILSGYATDWCHLKISSDIKSATVVLVDENDLEQFMRTLDMLIHQPKLIVICSEMTRQRDLRNKDLLRSRPNTFECITKPCGPRKFARALQAVLEKATTNGFAHEPSIPGQVNGLHRESTLDSSDPEPTNGLASLMTNGTGTSQPTDQSIRLAENSPTNILYQASPISLTSFSDIAPPTSDPSYAQDSAASLSTIDKNKNVRTSISSRERPRSLPQTPEQVSQLQPKRVSGLDTRPSAASTRHNTIFDAPSQELVTSKQQPRVLIVDDNKVNLRLLETYLRKKRQYTDLTKAEDGQQAVDAFLTSSSALQSTSRNPFDLIFMDISMPVMDGFAATRAIRQHEAMLTLTPPPCPQKEAQRVHGRMGAFIIAMTGLASAKDQAEGYESGCDVYMTKPVSFKEVSKLLDEWETSQQTSSSSQVVVEYPYQAGIVPISVES